MIESMNEEQIDKHEKLSTIAKVSPETSFIHKQIVECNCIEQKFSTGVHSASRLRDNRRGEPVHWRYGRQTDGTRRRVPRSDRRCKCKFPPRGQPIDVNAGGKFTFKAKQLIPAFCLHISCRNKKKSLMIGP